MATAAQYQAAVAEPTLEILAAEHAVIRRELESRIAEGYWPGSGENIDPHHITNAVRELISAGRIRRDVEVTRGGGEIETLQPGDRTAGSFKSDRL